MGEEDVASMQEQMQAMKRLLEEQKRELDAMKPRKKPKQDVPPSKVLHLRNTPKDVEIDEIEDMFEPFGRCVKVVPLPGKPQALVEFETIDVARRALETLERNSRMAQIRSQKIYFNYSHRTEIEDPHRPRYREDLQMTYEEWQAYTKHKPRARDDRRRRDDDDDKSS